MNISTPNMERLTLSGQVAILEARYEAMKLLAGEVIAMIHVNAQRDEMGLHSGKWLDEAVRMRRRFNNIELDAFSPTPSGEKPKEEEKK